MRVASSMNVKNWAKCGLSYCPFHLRCLLYYFAHSWVKNKWIWSVYRVDTWMYLNIWKPPAANNMTRLCSILYESPYQKWCWFKKKSHEFVLRIQAFLCLVLCGREIVTLPSWLTGISASLHHGWDHSCILWLEWQIRRNPALWSGGFMCEPLRWNG
jgi:hypothetical protein